MKLLFETQGTVLLCHLPEGRQSHGHLTVKGMNLEERKLCFLLSLEPEGEQLHGEASRCRSTVSGRRTLSGRWFLLNLVCVISLCLW